MTQAYTDSDTVVNTFAFLSADNTRAHNAPMGIRENLQALMKQKGLSEYRLAQLTGVPQPTIHRIVSGESGDPKTPTVKKIADYFGVTVEDLRGSDKNFATRSGKFHALSEDALELLAAFERLPRDRQQAYKDFLFMEVFALEQMPYLRRGQPIRESYDDYERRMIALARKHMAKDPQK